jgi:hypothetical protein
MPDDGSEKKPKYVRVPFEALEYLARQNVTETDAEGNVTVKPLSPAAQLTYVYLHAFTFGKQTCYPGDAILEQLHRRSVRVVRRYLAELEEVGAIVRPPQGLKASPRNPYRLLLGSEGSTSDTSGRSEGSTSDTSGRSEGSTSDTSGRSEGSTSDTFDTDFGQIPSVLRTDSDTLPIEEQQGRVLLNIAKQHAAGQASEAGCLSHAAAALSEIGAGGEVFAELSRFPNGEELILIWMELGSKKPQWKDEEFNRVGFIIKAVREASTNPKSTWYRDTEAYRSRQRDAALEAEKQDRRKQERAAAKSVNGAAAPRTDEASLPAWRKFDDCVRRSDSTLHGFFKLYVSAVTLAEGALLVTVAADRLAQFERYSADFERLARKANPDCPGVRFIPAGNANLSATADTPGRAAPGEM